MENYLNLLIEQFKQANGIRNVDINSQSFISELSKWIILRKKISDNYIDLLEYMDLYGFIKPNTAEVGKGKYDSIVKPFDTTIITPYSKGLEKLDQSRIYKSNFSVYENMPVLYNLNKKGIYDISPVNLNSITTFMTQNPYTPEQIKNWEQLHNSGKSNIIVGIYGDINDKDKKEKIKELVSLRDKLLYGSYKEEHTTIYDTYCYVIASDRKVKKLVKTR